MIQSLLLNTNGNKKIEVKLNNINIKRVLDTEMNAGILKISSSPDLIM